MSLYSKILANLGPIIAHRGASILAPENTMAAFTKAVELGANSIEFDVRLCACGEIVVFHDGSLQRIANKPQKIKDLSYTELKSIDIGSWFAPKFSSERILTLGEMLIFIAKHRLKANIELKPDRGQEKVLATSVSQLINTCSISLRENLVISSFSYRTLRYYVALDNQLALALLAKRWNLVTKVRSHCLKCVAIHMPYQHVSEKIIKQIHQVGYALNCFTVNDVKIAKQLQDWGVDGIFTDDLSLARI